MITEERKNALTALRDIVHVFRDAFQAGMEDRVPRLAAALSFYTMLSLSPTLVLVVAIAGSFLGRQSIRNEIINQAVLVMGAEGAKLVSNLVDNAAQLGVGLFATLVSIALILFAASGAFMQFYEAMNYVWHIEPYPDRSGFVAFLIKRGIAILMIVAVGFVLLGSLVINTILAVVTTEISTRIPGIQTLSGGVNLLVSLAIVTFLFALLFKYIPAVRVRWHDILPGAFVTALLFIIGENLISLYFRRSSVGSVYGAAGSLVILLLWIYYSTQILLFGAEFAFVYAKRYGEGIQPGARSHRRHPGASEDHTPVEVKAGQD